jgi:hypothetical protein
MMRCKIELCVFILDISLVYVWIINNCAILVCFWNRRGRYRMVVGFATTNAISAYHM